MKYTKFFLYAPTLVAFLFAAAYLLSSSVRAEESFFDKPVNLQLGPGSSANTTSNTSNPGATNPSGNSGITYPPGNSGITEPPGNSGITYPPGNSGITEPPGNSGITFNPFKTVNGQKITTLCQLINLLLKILLRVGGVIATLFIIWSGFLFIRAQGNQEKLNEAKWAFYTTIIGTAILLGSVAIADIIFNTLNSITNIGPKC